MKTEFDPDHLDVESFAQAGATLGATELLQRYARLMEEASASGGDLPVHWRAVGSVRTGTGVLAPSWVALHVEATLPQTCQRCLERVDTPLVVDREFCFAQDEATAAALDEEAENDVLVTSRDFDLHALIEDELLLATPLVSMHEVCPVPVQLEIVDPDFDAALDDQPHPFAGLAALKRSKPH